MTVFQNLSRSRKAVFLFLKISNRLTMNEITSSLAIFQQGSLWRKLHLKPFVNLIPHWLKIWSRIFQIKRLVQIADWNKTLKQCSFLPVKVSALLFQYKAVANVFLIYLIYIKTILIWEKRYPTLSPWTTAPHEIPPRTITPQAIAPYEIIPGQLPLNNSPQDNYPWTITPK